MKIIKAAFILYFFISFYLTSTYAFSQSINKDNNIIEVVIQDFSKTKLFKKDSVFSITVRDTVYQVIEQKINENHVKSIRGEPYPNIFAVEVIATPSKFLLDTTTSVDMQTYIPSRIGEKDGKVFFWWDNHYRFSKNTLITLNKFHLIERGSKNDLNKFLYFGTDDTKKGTVYYLCRNNLSIFRRIITNKATGYYKPPHVACK